MDPVQLLRFVVAFVFVMSLMWLLSLLMKRIGYGKLMMMQKEDRRLKTVEYLPLDSKNRLILVQRDNVEHLLLVGAEQTQVVETGIKPPAKKKKTRAVTSSAKGDVK